MYETKVAPISRFQIELLGLLSGRRYLEGAQKVFEVFLRTYEVKGAQPEDIEADHLRGYVL